MNTETWTSITTTHDWPQQPKPSFIKRLLCRLGLHRWRHIVLFRKDWRRCKWCRKLQIDEKAR